MIKEYKYILEILDNTVATKRCFYLSVGEYLVGSSEAADICICTDGVSREHAKFQVLADGGILLTDMGSTNGTFVDQKTIQQMAIPESALITFGTVQANLCPANQGAAIAIATSVASATPSKINNMNVLATMNTSMDSQLLAELGSYTAMLISGQIGRDEFARQLSRDWCRTLIADGIEIVKKSETTDTHKVHNHIIARASMSECVDSYSSCFRGIGGLEIHLWQKVSTEDYLLENLMHIAMYIIDGATEKTDTTSKASIFQEAVLPGPGSLNPEVQAQYRTCGKVAAGDIPILILGESGTGKEVLARWIHQQSGLDGPFHAMNCAALSRELLEAELFGVEAGAATGVSEKPGLLERSFGGTVFLDEFGDMAPETQAKLLRALEGTTIYRVGGTKAIPLNVRFIAATNQDLRQQVEDGHFRLDLFHRLAAFDLTIPPLRSRHQDIPLLTSYFFEQAQKKSGIHSPGITRAALSCLITYSWPGNIRELKNEIERTTLLLEPGEPLDKLHLSDKLRLESDTPNTQDIFNLDEVLRHAERKAFSVATATAGGDNQQTMELLGLSKTSYYRKLKQFRDEDSRS